MKIAILTIHHVPNYGAIMQAYSLKKTLQNLGFACDVVNYQPKIAIDFYDSFKPKFPRSLVHAIRNRRNNKFIDRFVISAGMPALTSPEEVFELVATYDAVICGSDQIWNADGFRGLDKTFFLGSANLPSTKKISYAPSIGSTDPNTYAGNWPCCGPWLKNFDALSVRDQNSQKMVESFGLPTPELVCDPTLLPSALKEFSSPQKKQYLVLYANQAVPPNRLRAIAEKYKLQIVSVGARNKHSDRNFSFADPKDWATVFSNAKIVITGKFHGIQLALLNGALPFYVGRAEKRAKSSDSLNRYGLGEQWIENPKTYEFENIDAGLAKMKQATVLRNKIASESLAWLEAQLG